MDTSIIRTPPYYGQFTWSLRDQNPYKAYFSKMDTSIIRTLIPAPLVSVIIIIIIIVIIIIIIIIVIIIIIIIIIIFKI